jgi:LAO/AO transport system kinase
VIDFKNIARNISVIENHWDGYEGILLGLPVNIASPVIGITGPPGSGKSTLVDALIGEMMKHNKTVAVLCIDPSSPFNTGALLGDRIRMSRWYTNEKVFIRSLASRKELGGLCPMIVEITEYLKTIGFDFIIVETVGVGQTEIEIAGLADVSVVNLVPGSGDEVQTMKAGILEIADIFVVNKSDKPGAEELVKNLNTLFYSRKKEKIPVIKTIATTGEGIEELYNEMERKIFNKPANEKKYWLFAERAYQIIQSYRMKDISKGSLFLKIKNEIENNTEFNLYRFVQSVS